MIVKPQSSSEFYSIPVSKGGRNTISMFTVLRRYTNLQLVDSGAFGTVVTANDSNTGTEVDIRKIRSRLADFELVMSEFNRLSQVEHPNIIRFLNSFKPHEKNINNEIYLVMEHMDHNLREVIDKCSLDHKTLSFFMYQMLCGVHHLIREGIVIMDLTPSSFAVNVKCQVKVIDYGQYRCFNPIQMEKKQCDTNYWPYRSPEVVLELQNLEKANVWSMGCIFAELITGYLLFQGCDKITQWSEIMRVMGTPTNKFIDQMDRKSASYMKFLTPVPPKSLNHIIPDDCFLVETEEPNKNWTACTARHLISTMIQIDSNDRCSMIEALSHPYVRNWYKEEEVNAPISNCSRGITISEDIMDEDSFKCPFIEEMKII